MSIARFDGRKQLSGGLVVCGITLLCAGAALAGPKGAAGDLYVADANSNTIVQIDSATGVIVGDFATVGMSSPREARFGPNGHLFVANFGGVITEYDGNTGAFIGTFASDGVVNPTGLRFAPNGHLFVYDYNGGGGNIQSITEYDTNGRLIGTFAAGLAASEAPLDFGPDGNLYVSNTSTDTIDRFAPDGTFLRSFAFGDGFFYMQGHEFGGPNGNLFAVANSENKIVEFDGTTGKLIGTFIGTTLDGPQDIAYGPDGNMWVTNVFSGNVHEFDGMTGAFIRRVKGFNGPMGITVKPAAAPGACLSMTVSTLMSGQNATWSVGGATPGSRVAVVYGLQAGSTVINGQLGYCATFGIKGVNRNKLVGTATADGAGNASFIKIIPANASGITVLTQAAEKNTCPDECVSNLDTQVVQ